MNDCEALMVLCSEVEDAGEDGVRLWLVVGVGLRAHGSELLLGCVRLLVRVRGGGRGAGSG